MTYATCKAIALGLFTMAFLLSASSLVLFIEDAPMDEPGHIEAAIDRPAQMVDVQMAIAPPLAGKMIVDMGLTVSSAKP